MHSRLGLVWEGIIIFAASGCRWNSAGSVCFLGNFFSNRERSAGSRFAGQLPIYPIFHGLLNPSASGLGQAAVLV